MYENVDPQLLRFLLNPMGNLESMQKTRPKPSLKSRLLYRIPKFRHFISEEQVGRLLLERIVQNLALVKEALPRTLFEERTPLDENTIETYLGALNSYFSIIYIDADHGSPSTELHDQLEPPRKHQLFTKFEYTNNRISESLKLRAEHNLAIVKNKDLWLNYYLAEAYFLIANGLMIAHLSGNTLCISPSEKFSQRLKAYWLAEISEESTKLSDMNTMLIFLPEFERNRILPAQAEEFLINNLMDKCLSIHADYVPTKMLSNPQYQLLRELVCFSLYLELATMLRKPAVSVEQMRCYVSPATLAMIDNSLQGKSPTLDCVSSFVERIGNDYHRGPVKLKYGLKKLIKQVLHKDFSSQLGVFFEKDYIMNYLQKLRDPRFVLHKGFKAENNAAIDGYDIDFVLQDIEENLYYFVQVKYKAFDLPIYFYEQCRLMGDENFRKGFDRQLLRLKHNMTEPSIRQKLNGLGLNSAQAENSHFILLHNVPFLNFHEVDGVFFYEWNLFRNLLQNGLVHYTNGYNFTQKNLLDKPRLHRPDEIVQAFFDQGPHAGEMSLAYQLFERTYARFSYDDLDVLCKTM
ncbi:hypothetical protein [Pseudomonas aeruginosa]|uniref:hypothetical protein n=1 Tax=Pseudomonas aeruginosa TaxID=287 RepID=UPI00053DF438|nr:hypothetical protein [Pseudomonas aeruginosa]MBG4160393.1 hypothetical protein [Pseudomonas aeruginosa]MBG4199142.1 hypothetical protein [Pseudomonas aeruginosa]